MNSSLEKGMGAFEMQQETFFAILKVPFAAAYCQNKGRSEKEEASFR